jgi:hypothetical protein
MHRLFINGFFGPHFEFAGRYHDHLGTFRTVTKNLPGVRNRGVRRGWRGRGGVRGGWRRLWPCRGEG